MDRAYTPINSILEQAVRIVKRSKAATGTLDAVPNNVLYGIDNDLYFIDTQIRLKE